MPFWSCSARIKRLDRKDLYKKDLLSKWSYLEITSKYTMETKTKQTKKSINPDEAIKMIPHIFLIWNLLSLLLCSNPVDT
jgi:hypothetical protein